MMKQTIFIFISMLLLLQACGKKIDALPDQAVQLKFGETAKIGKECAVKFYKVADSRCPINADCLIPGDLRVGVKINRKRFILLVGGFSNGENKASHDGYEVEVLDATPTERKEDSQKEDYTITIVIRKQ